MAAFIQELYKQSGFPSWAALARKARVPEPNLSKWKHGKAVPDGYNLFRLIRASQVSDVSSLAVSEAERLRSDIEADRETLREVTARLEARLAELEPAPRKRSRGGRS